MTVDAVDFRDWWKRGAENKLSFSCSFARFERKILNRDCRLLNGTRNWRRKNFTPPTELAEGLLEVVGNKIFIGNFPLNFAALIIKASKLKSSS